MTGEYGLSTAYQNRTRAGIKVNSSGSPVNGKIVKQMDIPLFRGSGTPASTPTITAKIWSSTGSTLYTSPTSFAPNTLTTSPVTKTFDFNSNTHIMIVGEYIGVEYVGDGNAANFVEVSHNTNFVSETRTFEYVGTAFIDHSSTDGTMTLWE